MEEGKKVNDFLTFFASFSLRERERESKSQPSFSTFFDEHHFVDEKVGKRGEIENKRKERDERAIQITVILFFLVERNQDKILR